MRLLILAFLLQVTPQITSPTNPPTVSPQPSPVRPAPAPQIRNLHLNSTPDLDPYTAETHTKMAEDIGTEKEAISNLKTTTADLLDKREKHDRPDIEDLINTRFHLRLAGGFIVVMIGILWWAKDFLWKDTIKPRLKRDLTDPPTPEQNPKLG